jgi:hypothetical protein
MVNRLARWNGASWSYLGSGTSGVFRIQPLPNGDLLALNTLFLPERWNGTAWSTFGTGFDDVVQSVAFRPSGELLLGGEFQIANGLLSPGVVRIVTTCPASATSAGAGCTGIGGPNVLTASTLPWIGATCTTVAGGLQPASLAVVVTGFSALSQPLASVLPQGSLGCSLLVSPDLLAAVATNAGQVSIALPLPNTLALAGLSLRQQVVGLELVAGSIVAATSTNALLLQCGTF